MCKKMYSLLIWMSIFLLVSLACASTATQNPTPASPSEQIAVPAETQVEAPPPLPSQPTAAPAVGAQSAVNLSNAACFGTQDKGVVCLTDNGWQIYDTANAQLASDYITALASCPNGSIAVAHYDGVSLFDGKNWKNVSQGEYTTANALACDGENRLWVAHFKGVSRYDGTWTQFSSADLATGSSATDLVYDVDVASDGTIWVVTANSVASFDGNAWTVYQEGQGFDQKMFFKSLAFDADGHPVVAHSNGVAVLRGGKWELLKSSNFLSSPEQIVVGADGKIWLGTLTNGIYVVEKGAWKNFTFQNSDLSSDSITALAVDKQGRVWASTEYGLSILTGDAWTVFRMDNSALPVNDLRGAVVMGTGPALPSTQEKPAGSLTGQVKQEDGTPVANSDVEICVEILGSTYFGDTPCADQPFFLTGKTDVQGKFIFENVPPGYYTLVMKVGDQWAQLTGNIGLVSEQVLVEPGEMTDVGTITIKK